MPQNKLFSKWYGYSSFPHTQRSLLIKTLNKGNYDVVVGVHEEIRKKMGQAGYLNVEKYNIDGIMNKWKQLFESIK